MNNSIEFVTSLRVSDLMNEFKNSQRSTKKSLQNCQKKIKIDNYNFSVIWLSKSTIYKSVKYKINILKIRV